MKTKPLTWLVFFGVAASPWKLAVADFRHTGFLWVFVSVLLTGALLSTPLGFTSIRLYLCFLGYAAASLLWLDGGVQRTNLQDVVQLAVPVLAFLAARKASSQDRGKQAAFVAFLPLAVAAACVFLPFLVQVLTGAPVLRRRSAAIGMVLLAACSLGLANSRDRRGWLVAAGCFVFCFLTGARVATFSILALAAVAPARKPAWIRRFCLVAVLALATMAVFTTETFQRRFFGEDEGGVEEIVQGKFASSGRFYLWPLLWEEAWERPLLGHGAGSSKRVCTDITSGAMDHPHNDYLRTYYEYGLIGSLLFWSFLGWMWARLAARVFGGHRGPSLCIAAQGFLALTAFFFLSATDNPMLYTPQFTFLLFWILGMAEGSLTQLPDKQADDTTGQAREPSGST